MNGILESKPSVGVGRQFDLHNPDVRKYGRPLVEKREELSTKDRFQLDRPLRPLVNACRGDGVEEVKAARGEPRRMRERAV